MSLLLLTVFLAVAALFVLALSLENESEVGVFTPSAEGDGARWYYAWHQVFTLDLANREDPTLAAFYDDGDALEFPREVEAMGLAPKQQSERYNQEIEAMFDSAGMPLGLTRLRSVLRAIVGGALHDIGAGAKDATLTTRFNVDELIYFNNFSRVHGPEAFAATYNDGLVPEAVITDPIGRAVPLRDGQTVARLLLPLALGVLAVGVAMSRTRPVAIAGLGVLLATGIGLGMLMADNWRFLIATSAFGLGAAVETATSLCTGTSGLGMSTFAAPIHRVLARGKAESSGV